MLFSLCGSMLAQDINKIIIDERSDKPMLIGVCSRDALTDSNFGWWYNSGYENHEIDENIFELDSTDLENISITIVLGTWCSDSRRDVPAFFKILDVLNFPAEKISLLAVNRDKQLPGNEIDDLEIEFVPTFIIYREGEEIGRIIEAPQETLEIDLVAIIKKDGSTVNCVKSY